MIMKILVASVNLLEPRCSAMEFVDLRDEVTLKYIEEFDMRPYSLSTLVC